MSPLAPPASDHSYIYTINLLVEEFTTNLPRYCRLIARFGPFHFG